MFNHTIEAIACVQNALATGKRKHLNNRIAEAGRLPWKGGSVEHNWDKYIEIARRFEHKA